MSLTRQQLDEIVARARPGERLKDVREFAGGRYVLALAGGEQLTALVFDSSAEAATVAAALGLLRAEVDLPIPQLCASDAAGDTVGQPYIVLSELTGEPLERALPRISDEQLYAIGRRLGEVLWRIHRLACEHYGALAAADEDAADDERSYVLARLERELAQCGELGLLDRHTAGEMLDWFKAEFKPVGRQAALVCGGLTPGTILVRQSESRWWISGLLGWERALGWSPAWDHVTFLDSADAPGYFSLRVGYGNGYDNNTRRTYEQVREHALLPYRALLTLLRMREAYARGDRADHERRREILRGLLRILEG